MLNCWLTFGWLRLVQVLLPDYLGCLVALVKLSLLVYQSIRDEYTLLMGVEGMEETLYNDQGMEEMLYNDLVLWWCIVIEVLRYSREICHAMQWKMLWIHVYLGIEWLTITNLWVQFKGVIDHPSRQVSSGLVSLLFTAPEHWYDDIYTLIWWYLF